MPCKAKMNDLFSELISKFSRSISVVSGKWAVALMVVWSTVGSTHGQAATYGDTEQAFEDCKLFLEQTHDLTADESQRATSCVNFVVGAWDMGEYLSWRDIFVGKDPAFCPPEEEVDVIKPILVFVNYVEEHPEKMEHRLAMVLEWSFKRAYPCTDAYFIKLMNKNSVGIAN